MKEERPRGMVRIVFYDSMVACFGLVLSVIIIMGALKEYSEYRTYDWAQRGKEVLGGSMNVEEAYRELGKDATPEDWRNFWIGNLEKQAGFGCLLAMFAVLHFLAAIGLSRWKVRGRSLQLGLSAMGLALFPIGTIINPFILRYLARSSIKSKFGLNEGEGELRHSPTFLAGFTASLLLLGFFAYSTVRFTTRSIQLGKYKRTVVEIQSIGAAVEAYRLDNNQYPQAGSMEELRKLLEPKYLRRFPTRDEWGNPFRYQLLVRDNEPGYAIASPGKDDLFEHENLAEYSNNQIWVIDYDATQDIVFASGAFVQIVWSGC